ncbi:MAG: 2-dehydro-3-deoxyglucarate aldolase [Planctomycetota bacterium]|nr:MAG: 2-dehydro-3-deoxyglucarate aldolase [Planctomycetota bacterium]
MRRNTIREKLRRGEPSIGTWLCLPDPTAARLMACVGFDWLTVEMEHAPVTIETAAQSFGAIISQGTIPLVRVPLNTTENIKRVLDNGAFGIVVPMVNSRAEAEAVVAAARYAPLGKRSVGGFLHAVNFGTDPATYYERANDEILVVVQTEHIDAVERADEILSVPGIDAFFIGPNDLLKSMGRKPAMESDDPAFVQALEHLVATGKKHGVAPGIHTADAAAAKRRVAEGFQFVALGSDVSLMLAKAQDELSALGLGGAGQVVRY